MKFGRKLAESAHPAFKNYYVAYKDLKEAIKIITGESIPSEDMIGGTGSVILELLRKSTEAGLGGGGIIRTAESQFQELLDHELNKINSFSTVQFSVLLEEIREILYRVTHSMTEESDVASLVDNLGNEIVAFDEYLRLNFSGFRKALKKFDKWNKSDSSNWFLQRVVRSDFMLIQIDKLLHGLSLIESLRNSRRYEAINASNSDSLDCFIAPQKYRRIKYFVTPDDLVEIETELLKNASALIAYPLTQPVPISASLAAERFTSGRPGALGIGDFSFVESVIVFDNESLSQYSARRSKVVSTQNVGGYEASVFSVRWNQYQHKEGKCVIVRECHPRFSTSNDSIFVIETKQKNISDLLTGKQTVANLISSEGLNTDPRIEEFLTSFVESVTGRNRPVAVYNYRRTLLKAEGVFLAVDKDIKFVDLNPLDVASVFAVPPFQFQAILTQRIITVWVSRQIDSLPGFVSDMTGKPGVSEVTGFSKAIHAEAVLHVVTELARPLAVGLPPWFVHTVSGEDHKELKFASAAAEEEFMASPLASPKTNETAKGKFDVLPLAQASSRLLIHDIVSTREPKQGTERRGPAPSPLLPSSAPLVGSELETPLLDRTTRARRPASSSSSIFDQIKYVLFGSVSPEIPEPVSKIEPKTFLANERTFLNWAYLAFILAAAAVTLFSVDPTAHLEASLISFAAVVTLGWSLNVYRLRVIALRNMKALETLMVSSNGASLVCLLVAFAMFMTWIGRFRNYLESLSSVPSK
jgi:SPX domain protein involved in polyphosphate accumulation